MSRHSSFRGAPLGASPESIYPQPCGPMDFGLVLRTPRNDSGGYGAGAFAIGLRCASAATVAVPIGPCSS